MISKIFPATAAAFLLASTCDAANTDWLRLGQGNEFVVDINKEGIAQLSLGVVAAVTRFIPRSSEPDTRGINPDAPISGSKPLFFMLVRAEYHCKSKEVHNIKQTHFDPNVDIIGDLSKSQYDPVPIEYSLAMSYLCRVG